MVFDIRDGQFYIGESGLTLDKRMQSHISAQSTPFGRLFKQHIEFMLAVPVVFINKISKPTDDYEHIKHLRKKVEFILIKCLNPSLNSTSVFVFKSKSKSFSRSSKSKILSRLVNQAPKKLLKLWKIKQYNITVTNGDGSKIKLLGFALDKLLKTIPTGTVVTISVLNDGYDVSDYESLKKWFGRSKVFPAKPDQRNIFLRSRLIFEPITVLLNNPLCMDPTKMLSKPDLLFEDLLELQSVCEKLHNISALSKTKQLLNKKYGAKIF
jgi:hypothetical protein